MLKLEGAYTAIVTPLNDGGSVDEAGLRRLVDFQIEGRIDGLVVCGTTGESATLSVAEKTRVFEVVIEQAAGRVPIVAGTGSNNTKASVELTGLALSLGADACLAVVPYYNKPSQDGLYRHFSAIEEVGLPVVLYNVPGRTVIGMTSATVERLAAHDGVVSIKEASADLRLDTDIMARCSGKITFLSGDDFTTFPFCTMGGHGCVSVVGNVAPGLMHDLVVAGRGGDLVRGRELHHKACEIAALCFSEPNPVPTKVLLEHMGVCGSTVRMPLSPMTEDGLKLLEGAYRRLLAGDS